MEKTNSKIKFQKAGLNPCLNILYNQKGGFKRK